MIGILYEHVLLGTDIGPLAIQTEIQAELFDRIKLEIQDIQEEFAGSGRLELIGLHERITPSPMGKTIDGKHIAVGRIEAVSTPLRKNRSAEQGR